MTADLTLVPAELRELRQWVAFRLEQRPGEPKPTKVPIAARTGRPASTTKPSTWSLLAEAEAARARFKLDGVGFVFAESDPFAGVDLDHCLDLEAGAIEPWAADVVARLNSYTEISPSGTGLHIFVRGSLPGHGRNCSMGDNGQKLEMYDRARYFTVTGNKLDGAPERIEDRAIEIGALYSEHFPPDPPRPTPPRPSTPLDLSDQELLDVARRASNGAKFARLWDGDAGKDHSAADLALCNLLAFWTGGDAARIDALFRQSGLMRPKWDEQRGRARYGEITIDKALKSCSEFYSGARAVQTSGASDVLEGPVEPDRFNFTDMGNGERLKERHGRDLRYCPGLKAWFVWDGRRWKRDATAEVHQLAKETIRHILVAAAAEEKSDRRKALVAWALKSETGTRWAEMVKSAGKEKGIAIEVSAFDCDPWALNTLSGTLDLRTGELRPHRRENMISHLVPHAYDPGATCPRWERFVSEIMAGRDELVTFLRRWFGYTLTGSVREESIAFFLGSGCNGKTKLAEAFRAVLGEDLCATAPPGLLLVQKGDRHPAELKRLLGKRLVIASEVPKGSTFNEERIKSLSGGDTGSSRGMFEDFSDAKPSHKLILHANDTPRVRDASDGFWRRFRIVPFDVSFLGREDVNLLEKLEAEGEGILAWAVRGCLEWQAERLGDPIAIQEATRQYRVDEDTVGRFLDEWAIDFLAALDKAGPDRQGLGTLTAKELYTEHLRWADVEKERAVSKTALGRELARRKWRRVNMKAPVRWAPPEAE